MANLPWPVLNIRCTCMVQKPSPIWLVYFEWLQSQHYESSDCPPPPTTGSPPPLCMGSITFTHLKENFSMVKLPYLCKKIQGKTCMVGEPSHVKQLSLIHVCKIGLKKKHIRAYARSILSYIECTPGSRSTWKRAYFSEFLTKHKKVDPKWSSWTWSNWQKNHLTFLSHYAPL